MKAEKPLKLGTDKIESSLKKVFKMARTIAEVWKDKKITLLEWPKVGIAMTAIPGLISDAKEAWAQAKDIDPDEQLRLQASFKEDFDLSNDHFEEKVEGAIDLLAETYALGKKWYQWADGLVPDEAETPEAVEV